MIQFTQKDQLTDEHKALINQSRTAVAALIVDDKFGSMGGTSLWQNVPNGALPVIAVVANKGNGNYLHVEGNTKAFIHTSGDVYALLTNLPVGSKLVLACVKQTPIKGISDAVLDSIEKSLTQGSLRTYRTMLASNQYRVTALSIKLAIPAEQEAVTPADTANAFTI